MFGEAACMHLLYLTMKLSFGFIPDTYEGDKSKLSRSCNELELKMLFGYCMLFTFYNRFTIKINQDYKACNSGKKTEIGLSHLFLCWDCCCSTGPNHF